MIPNFSPQARFSWESRRSFRLTCRGNRRRLVELEQECEDIGRDFSTIEITCNARMDPDHIKRLQDVGVHRVSTG